MQINRLFEIVYLLMARGGITAGELAERFEVSTRTIYRDVDILSGAGIPVYASKGRGGGIRLLPEFVLNRSLISKEEQEQLMASLHGMNAIHLPDAEPILSKMAALFGEKGSSWLDVDFTRWGGEAWEREQFSALKNAVIHKNAVSFKYYNSKGEESKRTAEPVKIVFKSQGWYLYAFCRDRQEFRFFKLTRMKNVTVLEECFTREVPQVPAAEEPYTGRLVKLTLLFSPAAAFRVYDEFPPERVKKQPDGSFLAEMEFPDGEWVYSFLLSFGPWVKVLEPDTIKMGLCKRLKKIMELYG